MRRAAGSWRRRAAAAAAFAGAFLIIASPASGQGSPYQAGPWQISAMGGWYSGSTPYIFEGPFRSNVKMTSSATFGMRLGYDFRTWGLEWSWWQARPDEKFETHSPVFIRQVRLDTYEFNGLLYLNQCGLRLRGEAR